MHWITGWAGREGGREGGREEEEEKPDDFKWHPGPPSPIITRFGFEVLESLPGSRGAHKPLAHKRRFIRCHFVSASKLLPSGAAVRERDR